MPYIIPDNGLDGDQRHGCPCRVPLWRDFTGRQTATVFLVFLRLLVQEEAGIQGPILLEYYAHKAQLPVPSPLGMCWAQ